MTEPADSHTSSSSVDEVELLRAKAGYLESRLMWNAGEVDRLKAELDDYKVGAAEEARAGDAARAQLAAQNAVVEAAKGLRTAVRAKYGFSVIHAREGVLDLAIAALKARLDAADVPATQRKTRAQAVNDWFHGLSGGEPAGPDVGEAFRAGWDAAQASDVPIAQDEGWRRVLWAHHGHSGPALYGDDGELQCHACPLDFKRDSISLIEARLAGWPDAVASTGDVEQ